MSEETYADAIDQGAAGTRFMVFDHNGKVIANAYEKHGQVYPEPGWIGHDADEIWDNTKQIIDTAPSNTGLDIEQLETIGVTNQHETTLVQDRETGQPIHNAIVQQDHRTTDRIETLEAGGKTDDVRTRTGFESGAYFSVTRAEWLLDNSDPIRLQRSQPGDIRDHITNGELAFGTIDTWFTYDLTGNHITDVTNASRTILFNIRDMEWDDELLNEFNVPHELLPGVHLSSGDDYYDTTDVGGFPGTEVPVAGALGDQQATLFGQTCFNAGDARNTYGAGSFMLANTDGEAVISGHDLLITVGLQRSGEPVQHALEGSIFITGAAIEWLGDMTLTDDAAKPEKLAWSVESTNGAYFVPTFTGLGTPHWDQHVRDIIVSTAHGTRREHIVRTTFKSIAFRTRDVTEATESDSEVNLSSLRVDGGVVKNNFLCQLQSDILDTEIVRPQVDRTTAFSTAYVAGLAVGYWKMLDELRENWQIDRGFALKDPQNVEHRHDRWKEAVNRSLNWAREG